MSLPTLAKIIRERHPDWSWNECRSIIYSGRVTVAGEVVRHDAERVPPDAPVEIHAKPISKSFDKQQGVQRLQSSRGQAVAVNVKVYFHDEHIIVVEKPSGIESVPFETKKQFEGRSHANTPDTMIDLARTWLEQREQRKLPPLKVVHRLDKGTSGVMVFARTVTAERHLGQLFRQHDITRSYVAVCLGIPLPGTIKSRLVENRGDGKRGSTRNKNLGKESVTHVTILESRKQPTGEPMTMISCTLETGRTHQIRIHLAEGGHPLCGETVYLNPRPHDLPIKDHSRAPRIALHARDLGFSHPVTGEILEWQSPLPDDLTQWWESAAV
jgi:23S rRNA pseudouridine1911/1915/1917 synthase